MSLLLTIVTLNLWGLPDLGFRVLAPLREERVAKVCEILRTQYDKSDGWDVVLLQEVWVLEDRDKLAKCGFPHVVDMENRRVPLDSGLLVLSRFPVQDKRRLTYPAPGGIPTSSDGEDIANKSAIAARLSHPSGRFFWIANTHLISVYDYEKDVYAERRRQQLRAFARWAIRLADKEPLIVGGDLNIRPQDMLWKDVTDAFKGFVEAPEAVKACTICPPNTNHRVNEGKVDHLLASAPATARDGKVAFDELLEVEDVKVSLSDHFGWATWFEWPAP